MAKYALSKGRDIPKVALPDTLLAERRLQVLHSYFQWWTEVVTKEFGIEKAKELAVKWGRQKGIHTARLYEAYLKKKGVKPNDLAALMYETGRSGDILGERYQAWIEGEKGFAQTLICPTAKMFVELGLGLECCVKQCDAFMEETWRALPNIAYKRTKGIDKDDICEWELWIKSEKV
jgi:hypothetical protein